MSTACVRAVLVLLLISQLATAPLANGNERVALAAVTGVLPAGGHHSRVGLGTSIVKLIRAGVIDPKKSIQIGIRTEAPEEGHDHGAPAHPMMWRKVAVTTAITLVLFAIVYVIAEFDILTLRDLAIEL